MKATLITAAVCALLAAGIPAVASADSGPPAAISQYVESLPSAGAPPKSKPKPPATTTAVTTPSATAGTSTPTVTTAVAPSTSTTVPARPKKAKPPETALERAGAAGKGLRVLVTEPDLKATTVKGALDPAHQRELRLLSAGKVSVLSAATSDARIVALAVALLVATIAFAIFARGRSRPARA